MMGRSLQPSRVVVGGGLFGCYAAIALADIGHDVLLVEQDARLLARASLVNQARLHTGLHYPRSLLTAKEVAQQYRGFRQRWPSAVRDFTQIYAVATYNSKTSGDDFADFIVRLGSEVEEVDHGEWFHAGSVSRAFRVEEPAFDARELRRLLTADIEARPNIQVLLSTAVVGGEVHSNYSALLLSSGQVIETELLVLAVYAGTNGLRRLLRLPALPLEFELAEVILGQVGAELAGHGFTVMDGPFWSLMPFGHGAGVSLTSVGLTPLRKSRVDARFACQKLRSDCLPERLGDCTQCPHRPITAQRHHQQQMMRFLKRGDTFTPQQSLLTVKAILSTSEVDDSRPTLIHREPELSAVTVLSGKVGTVSDLDRELA